MRFEVHTPVRHEEVATCIISGGPRDAYLKVRVNGRYVSVGPDKSPDDTDQERSVRIQPAGGGYDVWSKPIWEAGDLLIFELYDEHRRFIGSSNEIMVLPVIP